ncbi:MAG: domain containing protein [Frankiales bacterium]|nr:domain containing protein [Frankiales bacterium]
MSTGALEVERKYDVDETAQVPPLSGVVDGAVVGPVVEHLLVATYLDTPDLRLRSRGTTLRHRAGGTDAGWHLKLPAAGGRLELGCPGDDPAAPVPAELQALVRSVVRDRPLAPVAELRTTRVVHPVRGADGRVLVEVVDDHVEARLLGPDDVAPMAWREWEAELVTGDEAALDAVAARLQAAGAVPSGSSSKVGRVLGRHPAASAEPWWSPAPALPRRPTAGQVLTAHLAAQVDELLLRDPQVRRDEPDAVHRMRVACRRLRSALSTFGPLLDRTRTDPLRDELRRLAAELGAARDVEVLHERLRALLADEPPELLLGPVRQTVDDLLRRRYREAHARAVEALDGDRHLALLDALDALVADPPLRRRAARPAPDVLPTLVRRQHARLRHRLEQADRLAGSEQDVVLHEARKLAKRLRYACEAVEPVAGAAARRLAQDATALQDALGEHQDSVVTRDVLRELGAVSSRAGRNGFTFGRLHGLEQARAEASQDRWRDSAREVLRPRRVRRLG